MSLLAEARQVAADARVGNRAGIATKAAGDLLLDLEAAQIALGLVVIEGDG